MLVDLAFTVSAVHRVDLPPRLGRPSVSVSVSVIVVGPEIHTDPGIGADAEGRTRRPQSAARFLQAARLGCADECLRLC